MAAITVTKISDKTFSITKGTETRVYPAVYGAFVVGSTIFISKNSLGEEETAIGFNDSSFLDFTVDGVTYPTAQETADALNQFINFKSGGGASGNNPGTVDLSDYYTREQVNALLAPFSASVLSLEQSPILQPTEIFHYAGSNVFTLNTAPKFVSIAEIYDNAGNFYRVQQADISISGNDVTISNMPTTLSNNSLISIIYAS